MKPDPTPWLPELAVESVCRVLQMPREALLSPRRFGPTVIGQRLLYKLLDNEGYTPGEAARVTGRDRSTIYAHLRGLELEVRASPRVAEQLRQCEQAMAQRVHEGGPDGIPAE